MHKCMYRVYGKGHFTIFFKCDRCESRRILVKQVWRNLQVWVSF